MSEHEQKIRQIMASRIQRDAQGGTAYQGCFGDKVTTRVIEDLKVAGYAVMFVGEIKPGAAGNVA